MPDRRNLELLHGSYLKMAPVAQCAFLDSLTADSNRVLDDDLDTRLSSEWRSRLTAAWLIASSNRDHYVPRLGRLLIHSELTYAGQDYAIALAAIGGNRATVQLTGYRTHWLPPRYKRFEQDWVIGAFMYLDSVHGTHIADNGGDHARAV